MRCMPGRARTWALACLAALALIAVAGAMWLSHRLGPGLDIAAESGDVFAVRLHLLLGRDANRPQNAGHATPAYMAVSGTAPGPVCAEVLRLLLDAGADVDAVSDLGTPLCKAAERQREDVVRFLLQRGADPSKTSRLGFAPLSSALDEGNLRIATLLLDAGADPNAQRGEFPLLYREVRHGTEASVRLLLEHGADPNRSSEQVGVLPLDIAMDPAIRKALKEHGAHEAGPRGNTTPRASSRGR